VGKPDVSEEALLGFYLLLALGVSFLCSILEAVLLSITPSYIAALEQEGAKAGETLHALKTDIDRPLSAILSLNTIAHTIGAAGVGAQAQIVFGEAWITVVSAVLTFLILVFSEIIPKTLGANYWRKLGPVVARILPPLILSMYPLVLLSQLLAALLSRGEEEPTVSREEFSALADLVASEGIFDEKEALVLKNLMRFGALQAKDIMTPRTVLVAFDESTPVREFVEDESNLRFSRVLVYDGDLDDVTGYVLKHSALLEFAHENEEKPLGELKRDILVMPVFARVADVLEYMLQNKEHLVLLVGEYGDTAGIVTLEDVVETLLGLEIVDEVDLVEDMQALARDQWYQRAHRLGLVPPSEAEEDEA
jgi:CBS domain containing-hemolysin-like protein